MTRGYSPWLVPGEWFSDRNSGAPPKSHSRVRSCNCSNNKWGRCFDFKLSPIPFSPRDPSRVAIPFHYPGSSGGALPSSEYVLSWVSIDNVVVFKTWTHACQLPKDRFTQMEDWEGKMSKVEIMLLWPRYFGALKFQPTKTDGHEGS